PESWTQPIGDIVIPGFGMRDLETPMTLTEVAERTVRAGKQVVAARCPDVAIADAPPAETPAETPAGTLAGTLGGGSAGTFANRALLSEPGPEPVPPAPMTEETAPTPPRLPSSEAAAPAETAGPEPSAAAIVAPPLPSSAFETSADAAPPASV